MQDIRRTNQAAQNGGFEPSSKPQNQKPKERKGGKPHTFWRQFNEKPSIEPGCPGPQTLHKQQMPAL